MNADSEQILFDTSVTTAQDQPLTPTGLYNVLGKWLGIDNVSKETILDKQVITYNFNGRKVILLTKCITYLGNPHPIFKKRIQLPEWYQNFCINISANNLPYDIRFIGVYHYDGNVIFVDFLKDTYLQRFT